MFRHVTGVHIENKYSLVFCFFPSTTSSWQTGTFRSLQFQRIRSTYSLVEDPLSFCPASRGQSRLHTPKRTKSAIQRPKAQVTKHRRTSSPYLASSARKSFTSVIAMSPFFSSNRSCFPAYTPVSARCERFVTNIVYACARPKRKK